MSKTSPAVVALSPAAEETARRVADALPGARLHCLRGEAGAHLRLLFAQGTPIIGVCAAGILMRALAPLLADKTAEPPVLAVSADGASVVPLLGGHHGANQLARSIAAALGGHAAVTTASDTALGVALDEPPAGWRLADPAVVKPIAAALLAGREVGLEVEAGDAGWLAPIPFAAGGRLRVTVTDRAVEASAERLVLHPPTLVVGVGCARGTAPGALIDLALAVLERHGLSPDSVAAVASLDLKADEPAVHALAGRLGVPALFFPPAALEAEAAGLVTPSETVFRETGCHGVCEGAVLASGAALVVPKEKADGATCAIGRLPPGVAPRGRPRGRLTVVGIGPGTPDWRTREAEAAIAEAEDLVGYRLYLDLLGDAALGKRRHEKPLGEETERVRLALDLAAEGRRVALVSSGDAGIYALATLAWELVEREDRPRWNRLDIRVAPGVSALQAAAARAGAPIGHDFCTISLSDLLTPWEVIARRLKAAAEADFVVALYNPVSQRRREHLASARLILLEGRPPETPVVLARNLGRPEETVTFTTLGALTVDMVDMLTLVLIGSSETRRCRRGQHDFVYTPRGYAGKGA